MGSENKKKALCMILILSVMCELCFSALQFAKKMNMTVPDHTVFFPVQGDVYPHGVFRSILQIGNPPSPFYVDVDTGSSITWVQCNDSPNANCYAGPHPPFIPTENSETLLCRDPLCPNGNLCEDQNDECGYTIEYADNSICAGKIIKDSVTFKLGDGSNFESTLAFGCGNDQSDMPPPYNVDGVLGLSINGGTSIVGQLSNIGFKNALGHCFSRIGGGFAFIGDTEFTSEMVWTAMLPNQENHYLVGPVDVIVGSDIVAEGLQVVFDSGTTYTYFNGDTYQATVSAVKESLNGKNINIVNDANLPICWRPGDGDFKSIDDTKSYFGNLSLSFTIDNVMFELPPEAYLVITSFGNACLGILDGTERGFGDINLIGSIAFQDKLLIYDNELSKIGWAPSECV